MRAVSTAEVVAMLTREAARHGLTYERTWELWDDDTLDVPELRDLWLIWGTAIRDAER